MKVTPRLILRPGKERSLLRRHPWIYANAIARVDGHPGSGETVQVLAADGRFLAWAAYSPSSSLRARAWSFGLEPVIDGAWVAQRVMAAVRQRDGLAVQSNALRLVFGEADQLPGLVVDRYDTQLVVQFLAAGVEFWRETIVTALVEATGCTAVYERSDAAAREREGLSPRSGVLRGALPEPVVVSENGVRYWVNVVSGHKTGFYIDQRDNRALVAANAQGRRVLNCFCYTGGFSLAARLGGARAVHSIDSSAEALELARANEQLNGLNDPSHWHDANVFDVLKTMLAENQSFDLIILDPPKFAPSTHHLERAARAYKELNLKALRLLSPGGLLFTFSCSGAVGIDLFQKIVAGAVFDAKVDAQLLRRLGAGIDHPMQMTHPEGEYLKGLLVRRMPDS
jgi:23S rRNA (cytosine1962-C5)-methyltransferase